MLKFLRTVFGKPSRTPVPEVSPSNQSTTPAAATNVLAQPTTITLGSSTEDWALDPKHLATLSGCIAAEVRKGIPDLNVTGSGGLTNHNYTIPAVPFAKQFFVQRVEDGRYYCVDPVDPARSTWVDHAEWATDLLSTEAAQEVRKHCPYLTRNFDLVLTTP